MPHMRIIEPAEPIGVSDDTGRSMTDSGRLGTVKDSARRLAVSGKNLGCWHARSPTRHLSALSE
jgi:hypothetical protein